MRAIKFSRTIRIAAAVALATSLFPLVSVRAGDYRRVYRGPVRTVQQTQHIHSVPVQAQTHIQSVVPSAIPAGTPVTSQAPQPVTTPVAPSNVVLGPIVSPVQTVPNSTVIGTPVSPSGSHYRGTLRHEANHPVPNLFRADSKIRGLRRN